MLRVLMASGIDVCQGSCGFTDLMTAALGFDVDPSAVEILLIAMRESNPDAINFRITPQSTCGSIVRVVFTFMNQVPPNTHNEHNSAHCCECYFVHGIKFLNLDQLCV